MCIYYSLEKIVVLYHWRIQTFLLVGCYSDNFFRIYIWPNQIPNHNFFKVVNILELCLKIFKFVIFFSILPPFFAKKNWKINLFPPPSDFFYLAFWWPNTSNNLGGIRQKNVWRRQCFICAFGTFKSEINN